VLAPNRLGTDTCCNLNLFVFVCFVGLLDDPGTSRPTVFNSRQTNKQTHNHDRTNHEQHSPTHPPTQRLSVMSCCLTLSASLVRHSVTTRRQNARHSLTTRRQNARHCVTTGRQNARLTRQRRSLHHRRRRRWTVSKLIRPSSCAGKPPPRRQQPRGRPPSRPENMHARLHLRSRPERLQERQHFFLSNQSHNRRQQSDALRVSLIMKRRRETILISIQTPTTARTAVAFQQRRGRDLPHVVLIAWAAAELQRCHSCGIPHVTPKA
jgi:hypothetical protein